MWKFDIWDIDNQLLEFSRSFGPWVMNFLFLILVFYSLIWNTFIGFVFNPLFTFASEVGLDARLRTH